jgi:hypothetical protein
LHLLPTLWFRNTWSWGDEVARPRARAIPGAAGCVAVAAEHEALGARWLHCQGAPELLFTENETNTERLFGTPNASAFVKDAFDAWLVEGRRGAVNPARTGTKAAAVYRLEVPAGQARSVRLRLSPAGPAELPAPFDGFDELVAARRREADEFYAAITPPSASADQALVVRQALAGMFWSKQYYLFHGHRWLREHGVDPLAPGGPAVRNRAWFHMVNDHVVSMPDKWEYPWYAAWDLAFHAIAMARADVDFAKDQLEVMLRQVYQHPSGQIPAYEWNFSDVNPPVHA